MSQDTRTDVAREVLDELSAVVLRIGELIEQIPPDQLAGWVDVENIPLSLYAVERIKAMAWVHHHRPSPELPAPWKALWATA